MTTKSKTKQATAETETTETSTNEIVAKKIDNLSVAENSESKYTDNTKSEKKAYMYLGPNIKGGILINGKVYSDIPTIEIGTIIEKAPSIKKLFVEVKKVVKFKEQLKSKSSVAFIMYKKAVEELKGVE